MDQRAHKKKTELRRAKSLKATKGLRQVSKRRAKVNRIRKKNLEEAWGPQDTWRCVIGPIIGSPCFGEVHGHELLARARSGRDDNLTDPAGIVPACNFHNEWVASHPTEAQAIGLAKPSGLQEAR